MTEELETAPYRFVGDHPDVLANGRPVAPGEFVDLTDEDVRESYNEMLIKDGRLIGVADESERQAKLASSRVSRRLKSDEADTDSTKTKEG